MPNTTLSELYNCKSMIFIMSDIRLFPIFIQISCEFVELDELRTVSM